MSPLTIPAVTMKDSVHTPVCDLDAAAERQVQKSYWQEHSEDPTVETMMLDSHAAEIDALERPEVLSLLGSVEGLVVVELGAGIGRFTGELARTAGRVMAYDFMETSCAENRRIHGHRPSVSVHCGDVTELKLEPGSCDVVFSNWLLMYLSDEEVQALATEMLRWVKPGGCVFFRESCFRQSGDKARGANPTHYRNPREYFRIFDKAEVAEPGGGTSHLELEFCKCVDTYVKVKRNQNQICYKWTKAHSKVPRSGSQRHFLDNGQYSQAGILRYERIFGAGYISCGGEEITKELVAMLALKAGDRVLDVGCGVGGSSYYIAEEHAGVHCHGLDISVNALLLALERSAQRTTGSDVTFEVADCMRREYAPGSFSVIYARDTFLHVADKACLFRRLLTWLQPGGRLLISDYCRSSAPPSPGFASYMEERQYSLETVEQYGTLLTDAGFCSVVSEDRTQQFVDSLTRELAAFEAQKASLLDGGALPAADYEAVVDNWRAKLRRAHDGEQRWGLFTAARAADASP